MAEVNCPFEDMEDSTKPCTHVAKTEVMLGYHIEAKHCKHPAKKEEKEDIPPNKKAKRMESKPPTFLEQKTRFEFRRIQDEFESYIQRSVLEGPVRLL